MAFTMMFRLANHYCSSVTASIQTSAGQTT
jgi:hypothetical protein